MGYIASVFLYSRMEKKKLIRRLNIIKGQIEGLIRMIEGETTCDKILPQVKATSRAFSSLSREILKAFLHKCVREKDERAIREVIDTATHL